MPRVLSAAVSTGEQQNRPILIPARDLSHELHRTALVALQHFLPSIPALVTRFLELGFRPEAVFLLGKPYSTVPAVVEELEARACYVHRPPDRFLTVQESYASRFRRLVREFLAEVIKRLPSQIQRVVVLDEGGWLSTEIDDFFLPDANVVVVEHTMFGAKVLRNDKWKRPVVLMAASAAKTRFESPVIAEAIVQRLGEQVKQFVGSTVGIIGLGNIGSAVTLALKRAGVEKILGFDQEKEKGVELTCLARSTRSDLVTRSDIILGCTGNDSLGSASAIRDCGGRKWLASCSSADVEFREVVSQLAERVTALRGDPFHDARGQLGKADVMLLNGGFPLNFDRRRELEDPAKIQLTRELTFAAVVQAAFLVSPSLGRAGVMLDVDLQRSLVEEWFLRTKSRDGAEGIDWAQYPESWWYSHSGGQAPDGHLGDLLRVWSREPMAS